MPTSTVLMSFIAIYSPQSVSGNALLKIFH